DPLDVGGPAVRNQQLKSDGIMENSLRRSGLAHLESRLADRGRWRLAANLGYDAFAVLELDASAVLDVAGSGWLQHEDDLAASASSERAEPPFQHGIATRRRWIGTDESRVGRQRIANDDVMRRRLAMVLDAQAIFEFFVRRCRRQDAHLDRHDRR